MCAVWMFQRTAVARAQSAGWRRRPRSFDRNLPLPANPREQAVLLPARQRAPRHMPGPYDASYAVQAQTGMSENDVSNMKSSAGSNSSENNHGSKRGVISGTTTASSSSSRSRGSGNSSSSSNSSDRASAESANKLAAALAIQKSSRPWWGDESSLERTVPALLQSGKLEDVAQARHLLRAHADEDAPITQFYIGVACGFLDGEASTCAHYEKALAQLPLLHAARNNLIRGLMKRGSPQDKARALEQARLSAQLQPEVAEMQYQLGVVQMQLNMPGPVRETAATPTNHRTDDNNRAARIAQCKCSARTLSHRRTPCTLSASHPWSLLLVPRESLRTCLPSARCARAPLP